MSFRDLNLKHDYRSMTNDLARDFYIPILKEAKFYQRGTGFFSSSSLALITNGLCEFIKNGGKIQLVCSPILDTEDVDAIRLGYEKRKEVLYNALIKNLKLANGYFESERLNLLANMIADGVLDLKIAVTKNENSLGIYHEKIGIVTDKEDNIIAFSGSANATASAMVLNYESIDVYYSWEGKSELDHINSKKEAFQSIWNNEEKYMEVYDFPNLRNEIIERYKKHAPNYGLDREEFGSYRVKEDSINEYSQKKDTVKRPDGLLLYDYQLEAIDNWEKSDYRGIFDMATGTGKTLTGLSALERLYNKKEGYLAAIIVCPYQHLVEQWVEDIVKFNIKPIIGYSSSSQKDWKSRLDKAIRDQKIRKDKKFFCLICTNATFSSKYVQEQIEKIKSDILFIADEAHNLGSPVLSKLLDEKYKYRLALSATLDRHNDEGGTAFLHSFFGEKCIEYTLERAIKENKLTPYKYYPVVVYLSEEELKQYDKITKEISKCVKIIGKNKIKITKKGEILLIKRSRIVAGAIGKIDALSKCIKPYEKSNNILVYCGATNILEPDKDYSNKEEEDIRQITAVTRMLGCKHGMKVAQFTANEDMDTRAAIREMFETGSKLQAIVAIKCLDEGVNIPAIRTAFILASTTNPKEYIQRRGRVLRKYPGKSYAEIYDFITLPRPLEDVPYLDEEDIKKDLSLVKREVKRMIEFNRIAMNSMEANDLIWNIEETYNLTDDILMERDELI